MPYPQAIVVHVFMPPRRYQYVAQWPPDKSDPRTIVARDEVAKEVDVALGQIRSEILKGILEGFPEPERPTAPTLVGLDGGKLKSSNPASAFTEKPGA